MQTKVHKFLVTLALAATAAGGAGCANRDMYPDLQHFNPACENHGNVDGDPRKGIPLVLKLYADSCGNFFPDPAVRPLEKVAGDVRHCFEGPFDPDQVVNDYAARIRAYTDRGYQPLILIHGFNATFPEIYRSYKLVRRQMEHFYPDRKIVYIELYWNGKYGHPFAIWPEAQNNSKWAGLALRKLLNRIDPAVPVRVLTHSRGAAVICSALWNTDLRNTVDADRRYRDAQQAVTTPAFHDLRVGMLAPAIRAVEFESYGDRGEASVTMHERFVLGLNPDDAALNCGGFSWLMGVALGHSPDQFESLVSPRLNRGRARAFAVDFSGSVEHGFEDYLLRDVFEEEFLPKLMGDVDAGLVAGK